MAFVLWIPNSILALLSDQVGPPATTLDSPRDMTVYSDGHGPAWSTSGLPGYSREIGSYKFFGVKWLPTVDIGSTK